MHIPPHYRIGSREWGGSWSLPFKSLHRHNLKPLPEPRTWDKLRYLHQTHFPKTTLAPNKHQKEISTKGTHWKECVEGGWLTALLLTWGTDAFLAGGCLLEFLQDRCSGRQSGLRIRAHFNSMTPTLSFTLLEPQFPLLLCALLDSHSRTARRKLISEELKDSHKGHS